MQQLQAFLANLLAPPQAQNRLAALDPIMAMNRLEGKVDPTQAQFQPQMAPAQPMAAPQQQGMQAPAQPQQRSGGNFLSGLFGNSGKNQTIQFLMQQGMDEGTAALMAGNKGLLQNYLASRAMPDPDAPLKRQKLELEVDQMRNPTTDDVREYQFARDQGYKGSFTDFMTEMKRAGATSVTVGGDNAPGLGKLSTDYGFVLDPETREPVIDPETGLPMSAPIPGSPAAVKAEQEAREAETRRGVQAATELGKAETMLDATGNIKKIMEEADTPVTGTLSRPFAQFSSTPAGKVRSYVGTLQSGVALGAITRLKEASATGATGFGAMNEKELQLLIDDIGALDPDTTDPEIFMKTVDRIEQRFKRVAEDVKRNVSPERIRELGLDELLAGVDSGGVDENGWQDMGDGVKLRKVK